LQISSLVVLIAVTGVCREGIPARYCRCVGGLRQKALDVLSKDGMNKARRDLAHRDQNEVSEMKTRMRQREEFGFGLLVVVKKQIEIDRTRFLLRLVFAAEEVFDPKHSRHHLRWRDALAPQLSDHIEEIRFAFDLDWLGLVDTRELRDREARLHQPANRK